MKEFVAFFALQFLSYLNLTIDLRAVAHKQYAFAALTNILAPVIAWVMVRQVAKAKNELAGMLAVALGGLAAAMLGIWITESWG